MADDMVGMLTALGGWRGVERRARYSDQIIGFDEWLLQQGINPVGLDQEQMNFLRRAYESYANRELAAAAKSAKEEEIAKGTNLTSRTKEGVKKEIVPGSIADYARIAGEGRSKKWKKQSEMFDNVQTSTGGGGGGFPPMDLIDRGDLFKTGGKGGGQNGKTNQESPGAPWSKEESQGFQDSLRGLPNQPQRPISGGNTIGLTQTPGTGAGPTGGGAGGAQSDEELANMIMSLLGGNPGRSTFKPYKLRGGW